MSGSEFAQPTALTIGNFDGAHVGHAALVKAARAAVGDGGRVVVLAFDPNPLAVLRPDALPPRLTTFGQRTHMLQALGADRSVRLVPTPDFLQQDAETFIIQCVRQWRPAAIVEGADFRFGRKRAGSIETLRGLESQQGYRTIVVDPVEVALTDQSIVRASSSLARWLLAHGRVRDAAIVLGRPYEIEATVMQGDRRGRELGFPTANLQPIEPDHLIPADGIYAGIAQSNEKDAYVAAISVGTKPTFGKRPRTCEAHLLDYHGPLDNYGWSIRLTFTHWLRDQLAFTSADALIEQLHRDIARTRDLVRQSPGTSVPGTNASRRSPVPSA